jgi:energy-coupling factor transport system ATP-binding protein
VRQIAAMVDMDQLLESNPFELSGGQKQRVSLAGVLIDDVDILLFDEPLANLDPKTGKKAIEMIDEISRRGKTVLIIEHRLEDVLHCPADRLVVMGDGRILMDDTPDKVLASNILIEHGIREPLYLTACKYAGVQVSAGMKPASLDTFDTQACRERLHRWFEANQPVREAANDKPLLEVKDVCFSYDGKRQILNHINACVHEGEMLSIVGKNGAGKSTLAKVIVGFEEPDEGAVLLKGEDLKPYSISERARFTGIVLQNPNQMISKNLIYDEIALGLRIRQLPEAEIEEKVTKVLKICGLSEFRKWPISALSYGQKKRVTIASILVLNPEILILDEPTAGQDYAHYSDIMEFLKTLNENGQTIILITHDMHLMLEYTERAIVLADSEKIADEEAWKVLCDPALADRANLKETSLFNLAQKTGFEDPLAFVECFIRYDRQVRNHEA